VLANACRILVAISLVVGSVGAPHAAAAAPKPGDHVRALVPKIVPDAVGQPIVARSVLPETRSPSRSATSTLLPMASARPVLAPSALETGVRARRSMARIRARRAFPVGPDDH
jgi:hypothetical protein